MSTLLSGQWRCFREIPRQLLLLITAAWVLFAPAVATTQDSQEFFVPDLDSDVRLMAEVQKVKAQVAFADPSGIGAASDLQIAASGQALAGIERVTVAPSGSAGGGTKAIVQPGSKTAASLTVAAPPGQPISIHIDEIVAGYGYSLADFRCDYNGGGYTDCDGEGYTESAVGSGTLLVGVTMTGIDNLLADAPDGRFDVTVSYQ